MNMKIDFLHNTHFWATTQLLFKKQIKLNLINFQIYTRCFLMTNCLFLSNVQKLAWS